jgi:protein-S-isoprenylcysteine O-methyltransferase Ste14
MVQSDTRTPVAGDGLQQLQRRRKQALRGLAAVCVLLLLVVESSWRASVPGLLMVLQFLGLSLILLCIFGRTWCTLYIGGHKKRELIMAGPYSLVRNPLYVFTFVGTAGLGLLAGSFVLAVAFLAFAVAVFTPVVRAEEGFLADAFGDEFRSYAARVARFWPRFSRWEDAEELRVKPTLVVRTFADASLFLLAIPLIILKELAHASGWLPILLRLM